MAYSLGIVILIVCMIPVMGIVGIGILLTSGMPVFFTQKRSGKDNVPFSIVKFRTMTVDAETRKKSVREKNEANGPVFKIYNDPRYTRFGRFLAHTGLDELPQLWNVLKGDMVLIGPRPLPLSETSRLLPWQKQRLSVKPGIISPWILDGYHSQTFDEWMKSDISYIQHKSLRHDVLLSLRAVGFLMRLFARELFHAI